MAVSVGTKRRYKRASTIAEEPRVLDLETVEKESLARTLSPKIRIEHERDGVAVWSNALFDDPPTQFLREFLSRVFRLEEISAVEIDRRAAVGRLKYGSTQDAPSIWRKLQQVLTHSAAIPRDRDDEIRSEYAATSLGVDLLYLDVPATWPIRIGRVGTYLTTWRLRSQTDDRVRLTHPVLRNRKDVAYRLEEELTAILGVREFRTNILASSVLVRFNPRRLNVLRLLRHLENALPRLVDGLEGPPPSRRFYISSTLLTTSFVAQYFVPALLPFAVAGVAIYGFSNVVSALKLLVRGKIGLPVLYTGTLTFTLLSGMPFSASMMAVLMQLWPRWAYQTLTKNQRRLFATHRQRATWARLVHADGLELEVDIDRVKVGDTISVHEGEIVPVDGVISAGLAAVDQEALTGRAGALDKARGDRVYASTFVRAGNIVVRVSKVGTDTLTGYIGAQLPHGRIPRLPSSAEAEEVANRMVVPALAVSGLNLLLTGAVLPSQATIRPDYATAPRLSAQLAALYDLSDALRRGILFRDPAAMDRLPATDIYVLDDSSALSRGRIEVGEVISAPDVPANAVLSYVASAFPAFQNERARALMERCVEDRAPLLEISGRARRAGVISYRDSADRLVEVATPAYVAASGVEIPAAVETAIATAPTAWAQRGGGDEPEGIHHDDPTMRPLWVLLDGVVLGAVTFHRKGEPEGTEVIATLRARNPRATFVHISRHPQAEAEERGRRLGVSTCIGDLDTEGKVRVLNNLGRRTMWIGDGSSPDAIPCIEASTVSISVAGSQTVPHDAADVILLLPSLRGLVALRRIGRQHRALLKDGYRSVFTLNLLCVAGAFLGGFDTLIVGITTNIATGYVYTSHRDRLNGLIARMEAKMATELGPESEEHDPQEGTSDAGAHEVEVHEDYSEHDLDTPVPHERPV
jgi:manganese/zinc-transporting P-type ATPase C